MGKHRLCLFWFLNSRINFSLPFYVARTGVYIFTLGTSITLCVFGEKTVLFGSELAVRVKKLSLQDVFSLLKKDDVTNVLNLALGSVLTSSFILTVSSSCWLFPLVTKLIFCLARLVTKAFSLGISCSCSSISSYS